MPRKVLHSFRALPLPRSASPRASALDHGVQRPTSSTPFGGMPPVSRKRATASRRVIHFARQSAEVRSGLTSGHYRMRAITYWTCASLVLSPVLYGLVQGLLSLAGMKSPPSAIFLLLYSFASPVPQVLEPLLIGSASTLLSLGMLFLVLRRAWLLVIKREGVPHSYRGFPQLLGHVGSISFALGLIALVSSFAIQAGSGAPAGLLLLPATLCVPWAFLLTEVQSFRKPSQA